MKVVSKLKEPWLFPDLWIALCSGRPLTSAAVSNYIVKTFACPLGPKEVWKDLLNRGQFLAAQKLLDEDLFIEKVGSDVAVLLRDLDSAKQKRLGEHLIRCRALKQRLHREESLDLVAEAELKALVSLEDAEFLLSEVEALLPVSGDSCPEPNRATKKLMSLDDWPYTHIDSIEVCRWFLQERGLLTCPKDFEENWCLSPDDFTGNALARVIYDLLESPQSTSCKIVSRFVRALTAFLGVKVNGEIPVEEQHGFYLSSLKGCGSPWLPSLVSKNGPDIPIAIPDPNKKTEQDYLAGPIILFNPWQFKLDLPCSGVLLVTPEMIFPLMKNAETRAAGFIRSIGLLIPTGEVLPPEPPNARRIGKLSTANDSLALKYLTASEHCNKSIKLVSYDDSRDLIETLLHFVGVYEEDPRDLDLMVLYGGGRYDLIYELLRHVLKRIGSSGGRRRGRLNQHIISEVFNDDVFQKRIEGAIFEPLNKRPLERLILGLIYEKSITASSKYLLEKDIQNLKGFVNIKLSNKDINNAIKFLYNSALVEKDMSDKSITIGMGGVSIIVGNRLLRDTDLFILEAIDDMTNSADNKPV
jgi:hypothetical protein